MINRLRKRAEADLDAGAYQPEDDIFDWLRECTVEEVEAMEAWLRGHGIRETGQMRISEFAWPPSEQDYPYITQ